MQVIDLKTEDNVNLYGILYEAKCDKKERFENGQEQIENCNIKQENIGDKEKAVISVHGMATNIFKKREKVFSEVLNDNGISYFCFNNRGHDLMNYMDLDKHREEQIGGTAFENVCDCYYDIKSAIKKAKEMGYKDIYLQGHSLGSTKVVYAYNRLKQEKSEYIKDIKGVILLSLVDIPELMKIYLGNRFEEVFKYAESKENEENQLMPPKTFVNPISVKNFLQYVKYNEDINFIQYSKKDYEYEVLNNIEVPLFIRWGNVNEFIQIPAEMLSKLLESKIKNEQKDIGYVNGANHHYTGKEEEIAKKVMNFVKMH